MIVAAIKGLMTSSTQYAPADAISVAPGQTQTYMAEAYCLDFEKENPLASDHFDISKETYAPFTPILEKARTIGASSSAIQAALWIRKEGTKLETVEKKFPLEPKDRAHVLRLLE